jgi:Signal transduction histidine kinase, nitrogen specific
MLFKIKNIATTKQSIIQLTLFKIIFIIFVFLVIFIFSYGQSFWKKQALQFNYDLLINASDDQIKIQPQIPLIEELKKDTKLTKEQKRLKVENIIQSILYNKKNDIYNGDYLIGYYDIDLDLIIKNYNNNEISLDEISAKLKSVNDLTSNKKLTVNIPIYDNKRLVGYLWAYAEKNDFVLGSFYDLNEILILVLFLLVSIIFLIRKFIKQIESSLDEFCKMIINNNSERDREQILTKLPELVPVLNKITAYMNDLKRINQELESSKLKTTQIIEGISDGFCALDRDWKFTFVNNNLIKTTNNEFADLIGKSVWDVFPQAISTITYDKMREAMIQNHSVHWEEGGFTAPDREHEYHAYPYLEGLTVFFRDISELKRQQQELGRLERLNLIGQLAAGISHEIRNPLTTVKGFLQIFGSKTKFSEDKEVLDLMISEIDRANAIISDFLSLSKISLENIKLQNINQTIGKLFPMLQADAFNSNKQVVLELDDLLPDIRFNENEIKQLILNLVRNGLEVTPENGKVTIKTFVVEDKVVLAITDQGPGIPQEIQDKIGTPFFTTKETGTGLGLAISMGIAQRHEAVFKFETGKNGTIFTTIFPTLADNDISN